MLSISKSSLLCVVGLVFSVVIIYGALRLGRAGSLSSSKSTLQFPDQVHDFGIVRCSSSSNYTFVTKNDLSVPVIIDHITRSCGCTSAQVEPMKVMPGQNWNIETQLSTKDMPVIMSSEVYVEGHAGGTPIKALYALHARAEAILTFPGQSGLIDLGDIPLTTSAIQSEFVVKRGKYPLQFDTLRVDCPSKDLLARVLPLTESTWKVMLQINSDNKSLGTIGYLLNFTFSNKGKVLSQTVEKKVYADLQGPVFASTPSILFNAKPGEEIHTTIEVKNRNNPKGKLPDITQISCNSENVHVHYIAALSHNAISVDYIAPKQLSSEPGTILLNVLDHDQNRNYKIHINYLAIVSNR
jgi:hypothetical protein